MKNFLNNLGIILVLLGVICLVVYFCGVQKNFLLAEVVCMGASCHVCK